jgi:hypothetical protein
LDDGYPIGKEKRVDFRFPNSQNMSKSSDSWIFCVFSMTKLASVWGMSQSDMSRTQSVHQFRPCGTLSLQPMLHGEADDELHQILSQGW